MENSVTASSSGSNSVSDRRVVRCGGCDVGAVSYTHLDVYKRQA